MRGNLSMAQASQIGVTNKVTFIRSIMGKERLELNRRKGKGHGGKAYEDHQRWVYNLNRPRVRKNIVVSGYEGEQGPSP